jgi:DNA-binding NarL/FixJ family response regulator
MEPTKPQLRVLIADDHPIVRSGLRQTIEADAELRVIAEAGAGQTALDHIEALQPDVAVLDLDMPALDGLQVARAVIAKQLPVAIIFLTIHNEPALFQAAMELGVKGYVLKDSATDEIVIGIKAVAAGQRFTSLPLSALAQTADPATTAALQERLTSGVDALTPTELRILKALADYKTSKEIAAELNISVALSNPSQPHLPETRSARQPRADQVRRQTPRGALKPYRRLPNLRKSSSVISGLGRRGLWSAAVQAAALLFPSSCTSSKDYQSGGLCRRTPKTDH